MWMWAKAGQGCWGKAGSRARTGVLPCLPVPFGSLWPSLGLAQRSWFTEALQYVDVHEAFCLPHLGALPSPMMPVALEQGYPEHGRNHFCSLSSPVLPCLVLFHSPWSLSCACCCVSTNQLGSCQYKPAREPFDSCRLPRVSSWWGCRLSETLWISLPRVTWEPDNENEKAPLRLHFSFSTLAWVSWHS